MKNKHLIGICILALFIAGITYIILSITYLNVYTLDKRGIKGTVKKTPNGWGIESLPIGVHKISVEGLPEEMQMENLKVRCSVNIRDVIGMDAWDVYASVSNCKEIK